MRRMARRAGVKRFSRILLGEVRGIMSTFVRSVISTAVTYTEFGKRSTVTAQDVIFALRKRRMHLYGY